MSSAHRAAKWLPAAALAVLLTGCAPGNNMTSSALPADRGPAATRAVNAAAALASDQPSARPTTPDSTIPPGLSTAGGFATTGLKSPQDQLRLERLWRERAGASADFALGPGDVIEISVPVVAELKDRTERVAGNGTISLPFVGTMPAAGLTEKQLKAELTERLSAIMYRPQVDLFVKQYHSRQVAVVGQVDKPGLYDLTGPNQSLLDMLNDAGGINKDAAQRVLFIPAHENHDPVAPGALTAAAVRAQDVAGLMRMHHPIEIGLSGLSRGSDPAALALPARPGDMLVVPGAGEVVVEGWVDKPGSYKITPGLTVAGAVGAAGGALFASDRSAVTIMRDGAEGRKIFLTANLEEIRAGQETDIAVLEGDVISVPYSIARLLPYAAVSLIGRGLYFSAAAPVF